MEDVAADGDGQALDAAEIAPDGQSVEQRLGRMLMRAVPGVDDRAVDFSRQQRNRPRRVMAYDENVRPHGVECHGGVDQRLALFDAGRPDRHVHHVGAEPFARELERGLGAGRGLEEEVDLGAPAQGRRASSPPGARSPPLRPKGRAAPRFPGARDARCRAGGVARRRGRKRTTLRIAYAPGRRAARRGHRIVTA